MVTPAILRAIELTVNGRSRAEIRVTLGEYVPVYVKKKERAVRGCLAKKRVKTEVLRMAIK